ncbi:hypothetical protein TCON_0055 [Astathelohania contejeani]|uniref:SANTA domain-containing protein n=1 Tax=Astathelohania contejeani TaxID=164912 RepID=A0ABQ7I2Q7_9MICR|nr:hypothetical protein TCON_0055 [Thelohania contejeani]
MKNDEDIIHSKEWDSIEDYTVFRLRAPRGVLSKSKKYQEALKASIRADNNKTDDVDDKNKAIDLQSRCDNTISMDSKSINHVPIKNWHFKLVNNPTPNPKAPCSLWIVLCGQIDDNKEIQSSFVISIEGKNIIYTENTSYSLCGDCNIMECKPHPLFDNDLIILFMCGFPLNWKNIIVSEARRIGSILANNEKKDEIIRRKKSDESLKFKGVMLNNRKPYNKKEDKKINQGGIEPKRIKKEERLIKEDKLVIEDEAMKKSSLMDKKLIKENNPMKNNADRCDPKSIKVENSITDVPSSMILSSTSLVGEDQKNNKKRKTMKEHLMSAGVFKNSVLFSDKEDINKEIEFLLNEKGGEHDKDKKNLNKENGSMEGSDNKNNENQIVFKSKKERDKGIESKENTEGKTKEDENVNYKKKAMNRDGETKKRKFMLEDDEETIKKKDMSDNKISKKKNNFPELEKQNTEIEKEYLEESKKDSLGAVLSSKNITSRKTGRKKKFTFKLPKNVKSSTTSPTENNKNKSKTGRTIKPPPSLDDL